MTNGFRRRDPQPLTHSWELPVLVLVVLVSACGAAALAGQGLAAAVAGGGWVWPVGDQSAVRGIVGLLSGRPGRGPGAARGGQVAGVLGGLPRSRCRRGRAGGGDGGGGAVRPALVDAERPAARAGDPGADGRSAGPLNPPRVVTIRLAHRGRRDIPIAAFDGNLPLQLTLDTPIVQILATAPGPEPHRPPRRPDPRRDPPWPSAQSPSEPANKPPGPCSSTPHTTAPPPTPHRRRSA